jgi:hypothetical protein
MLRLQTYPNWSISQNQRMAFHIHRDSPRKSLWCNCFRSRKYKEGGPSKVDSKDHIIEKFKLHVKLLMNLCIFFLVNDAMIFSSLLFCQVKWQ